MDYFLCVMLPTFALYQ